MIYDQTFIIIIIIKIFFLNNSGTLGMIRITSSTHTQAGAGAGARADAYNSFFVIRRKTKEEEGGRGKEEGRGGE